MDLLNIEDLVVAYGVVRAVKGISLRVEAGEIVALIGPNGAGKTTTLLSVSGVLAPSAGTIRFGGDTISGLPAHVVARRGIAQVVEGRGIFGTLSVLDNLALGAIRRCDRPSVDRDIAESLERFPRLAARKSLPAAALSGGEQQMLAIARALLGRPRVLLLDEPTMGLAPLIAEEIFRLVAEIGRRGTTVLLVEQNALRALEISSRAYVLASGVIVRAGASADLRRDPSLLHAYLGDTA
ncbi:MAG TPA: ABC transporter ATP-binding protein [Casimicrobiaceae bacterium]